MKCPYWDSGWCYAPRDVNSCDVSGACPGSEFCDYYTDTFTVEMTREDGDDGEEHF